MCLFVVALGGRERHNVCVSVCVSSKRKSEEQCVFLCVVAD
jgi:hypothetical protein